MFVRMYICMHACMVVRTSVRMYVLLCIHAGLRMLLLAVAYIINFMLSCCCLEPLPFSAIAYITSMTTAIPTTIAIAYHRCYHYHCYFRYHRRQHYHCCCLLPLPLPLDCSVRILPELLDG